MHLYMYEVFMLTSVQRCVQSIALMDFGTGLDVQYKFSRKIFTNIK